LCRLTLAIVPTNIQVSQEVWTALNRQKRPGESFDDVLRRELGVGPTDRDGLDAALAELPLDEEWQAAARACHAYIREHGEVSPQELRDAVHPEVPVGSSAEWWWKKVGGELEQLPGIVRTSQRRYEWRE
jgi:DNA-binding transcriptional LysR family regulator